MNNIKPLAKLTQALCLLLKIDIAITIAAIVAQVYNYYSYTNLVSGTNLNETILLSEIIAGIIGVVQIILLIILGITFLQWIYRVNKNLQELSTQTMRFTPGWSVGWYFIPIANLFKPYQVMKEIWQVSHKNKADNSSIVSLWWFFCITSSVVGRIAMSRMNNSVIVEDYLVSSLTTMGSGLIDTGLAIAALVLVTRIGAAYSQNFAE